MCRDHPLMDYNSSCGLGVDMAENEEKELSAQEDAFCKEYVLACDNASAAVRKVYNIDNDYVRVKATRLIARDSIQKRINEYRQELKAELGISDYGIAKGIIDVKDRALKEGDLNVAVKCYAVLGKAINGSGNGVKSIASNPDGTVKIEFSIPDGDI